MKILSDAKLPKVIVNGSRCGKELSSLEMFQDLSVFSSSRDPVFWGNGISPRSVILNQSDVATEDIGQCLGTFYNLRG